MAYYPLTQRDHGFQILDLKNLARSTSKTFERLAPYTLLQNPSSSEAQPVVTKVINKLKTYIEAIDSSINVVHMAYQMSKIAGALWTNPGSLSEKQALIERIERQKRLEDLVVLADEAHKKAQKAFNVFKHAEQDFYRIAASTKDLNHTIQIPVDPALRKRISSPASQSLTFSSLAKLITKPFKDIGTDLVSNLSLLKEFSRHISNLTSWSGGVKASILAIDGTVTPTRDGYLLVDIVRPKWDKVRTDCLIYHTI
ncbi:hypothetical protein H0H93_015914, partial [Arthromyces matolae]